MKEKNDKNKKHREIESLVKGIKGKQTAGKKEPGKKKRKNNKGKAFENNIKKAFLAVPDTSVDRVNDNTGGYYGVKGICDFIIYHHPGLYYIECKSIHGDRFPFIKVTDTQWEGLLEKSKIKGVTAGVILWYIDHDITVFIPIKELERYKKEGNRGLNYKKITKLDVFFIEGKKKKVYFNYDMTSFLESADLKIEEESGNEEDIEEEEKITL